MKITGFSAHHQENGDLRITVSGTEGAAEFMRSWIADTGDALAYAEYCDALKASMQRKTYEEGQFIPDSEDESFRIDE